MSDVFRVYEHVEKDGYPREWHKLTYDDLGFGVLTERAPGIKHLVRAQADHRCVRCHHPYRHGENGSGEWSPCDDACDHGGAIRETFLDDVSGPYLVEAQWRILTVHHLNGDKADCRWWNLASLCQRCHLQVQGRVIMARVWPWEHSEWFKAYVAAYYASVYLAEELTREQTLARLDELLALERQDVPA